MKRNLNLYVIIYLFVDRGVHCIAHMGRSEDCLQELVFPAIRWVPAINLGSRFQRQMTFSAEPLAITEILTFNKRMYMFFFKVPLILLTKRKRQRERDRKKEKDTVAKNIISSSQDMHDSSEDFNSTCVIEL